MSKVDFFPNQRPGAIERLGKPTPRFFRKLRRLGITLLGVSGAIAAAPIALPALVIAAAGYIGTAGVVAAAVAQFAVEGE